MKNTRLTETSTTDSSLQILKLGKFTILKDQLLGRGAFSSVYLTIDDEQNFYATKILSKKIPESIALAKTEARLLSSLRHPNIVKYYGSFESTNNMYIVLHYHKGKTLREHLNGWKAKPLKRPILPELIEIITEVIKTMEYLVRSHQIVHKDIKPDNIIYDNNGKVILLDFGLARKKNYYPESPTKNKKSLTLSEFVGTLEYMSPQILNKQSSLLGKEDIWSLGIFMHELLTYGQFPWKQTTEAQLYQQIIGNPYKFPSKIKAPKSLISLITGCLRVDPKKRLNWDEVFKLSHSIQNKIETIDFQQQQNTCSCSLFSFRKSLKK